MRCQLKILHVYRLVEQENEGEVELREDELKLIHEYPMMELYST
jgi:hypothetical protein